jgi:protein SCO1/2
MKKQTWLPVAMIVAACGIVLAVWLSRIAPPSAPAAPTASQPRRDFALTDVNGQNVSLATFQGKWVLMFFGFTNCPDACPTAMMNVGATLREMGSAADRIQPVFVTIDPERDTPALLKDYLLNFDERIVGLSGTAEQTAAVARAYSVYYKKVQTNDGSYAMEHTTALYLISPKGEYVRPYKPDEDPELFAKELLKMIAKAE